jgi:DNA (cytosine-5)-methyltransferase 1
LNELSLFSGGGGGLLASKYYLGFKTIGYVEFEDYCERVLRQRIKDGLLDHAPIFSDIRSFIDYGYAESYKNMVDVVTGGPPCQGFSVAGKQLAEKDERNMWPAMCRVIEIVEPRFVLVENVPGLISCGYIGNVLKDLSEIGYDAKWQTLSAKETGACHKRDRLWVLAYSNKMRKP